MIMSFSRNRWMFGVSAIMAFFALSAEAWCEPLYVSLEKGRVRSGPGTQYDVLWEAPKLTPFEYLARYQEWYAVRDFQGDVGWIHKGSVTNGVAGIVIKDQAKVIKAPHPDAVVSYIVEKHYLLIVTGGDGDWLKVKDADGEEGWILKDSVWASR